MKTIHLILALVLLTLPLCRLTAETETPSDFDCAATLEAMRSLRAAYPLPDYFIQENPIKQGGEFDPMRYFTILDHLSMEPGYVLDFVYTFDFLGGYPTLLARPADLPPYRSWADVPPESDSYLNHVIADGTEAGYFQLIVLAIMGQQFYLYWHANYNDLQIVCDRGTIQAIIAQINSHDFGARFDPLRAAQALTISDVPPAITVEAENVQVRLVVFTNWGGFYRLTFDLNRQFPHNLQSPLRELLVPYDCGILF